MRTDAVRPEIFDHILAALMPENETAMRISLATGLRIDDVLALRTQQLQRTTNNRITVRERKTGKTKRVYLPQALLTDALKSAGEIYVFPHRTDCRRHRTRQAVWKDLKRAAALFRISASLNVAPHSARKIYACEAFKKTGDMRKVQELMNHADPTTTALYIMAEEIANRKTGGRKDPRRKRK